MFRPKFNLESKRNDCHLPDEMDAKRITKLDSKRSSIVDRLPRQKINKVSISFMDSNEIEKQGIRLRNLMAENFDSNKTETVLDRRLGTSKLVEPCKSCCQTTHTCRGHIGYIPLKYKMINPLCRKAIELLLTAVCHTCGSLITPNKLRGSHENRLKAAASSSMRIGQCKCGEQSNIVTVDHNVHKLWEPSKDKDEETSTDLFSLALPRKKLTKNSTETPIDIHDVIDILDKISAKDLERLGFGETHPRAYIVSNLVVPAIQMRPILIVDGMKISPVTKMYDTIIECNLKVIIGSDNARERNKLFLYVNRIMGGPPLNGEMEIQGYMNVIKGVSGKRGIIRGNVLGKRGNYCSRSVLGPGSEAGFGEISYPYITSRKLSIPIKMTQYNRDYVLDLWHHNGVRALIPGNPLSNYYDKVVYFDETLRSKYTPVIGDTVHKYITSGDSVTFNRQPTLSRYSILGKRAVVDKSNMYCNRINSSSTKASNADFDGDEGNIYPHQSLGTRVEAEIVSNIRSNIIDVLNGSALLSIEQHGLIGLYLLTHRDYGFDNEDWDEAVEKFAGWKGSFISGNFQEVEEPSKLPEPDMDDFYARLKAVNGKIGGKACFSMILPRKLNLNQPVKIVNGILVEGHIDKAVVKSLVKTLVVYCGTEIAADFITAGQRMADWYNSIHPTSMSYSDIVVPEADEMIKEDVAALHTKLAGIMQRAKESEESPEITEMHILTALNITEEVGKKIANLLPETNSINVLRLSGAKGSIGNTSQMVGMIGQIALNGKRPPYNMAIQNKYPQGSRSMPYFEPLYWPGAIETAESKGFCTDSYRTGIDISEIFFSLGDGRNGLITTKLGTATNGYFTRKLVRSFEDYMVTHDGSVVSTMGKLVSSGYLDGIAPANTVKYRGSPKTGEVYGFMDFQKLADMI